jgi:hypothetical protein
MLATFARRNLEGFMGIRQSFFAAFWFSVWALFAAAATRACEFDFVTSPSVTLTYDPFRFDAASAYLEFDIFNKSEEPCEFAVVVFGSESALSPRVAGASENRLISNFTGDGSGISFIETETAPLTIPGTQGAGRALVMGRSQGRIRGKFSIAAGQVVSPQTYAGEFGAALYLWDGQKLTKRSDIPKINITAVVNPVMSLTLAGGSRFVTLDFGELKPGAVRQVVLRAFSNQQFRLALSSESGGVMRPTAPLARAEEEWRIPYTVSLRGASNLSLDRDQLVTIAEPLTTVAGLDIPLDVRISDMARQRAGQYRDVITVSIDASP